MRQIARTTSVALAFSLGACNSSADNNGPGVGDGASGGLDVGGGPSEAALTWRRPTTNVDDSPLTDLGGFKVYYGTLARTDGAFVSYDQSVDVGLDNICQGDECAFTLDKLPEGMTFFAVTAYDDDSNESDFSNEVSKEIKP